MWVLGPKPRSSARVTSVLLLSHLQLPRLAYMLGPGELDSGPDAYVANTDYVSVRTPHAVPRP